MTSAASILALLVLDSDSNRLACRYCSGGKRLYPTLDEQRKFERKIVQKLPKPSGRTTDTDVALIGDQLIVFKNSNDVFVCVVTSTAENELVVAQLLEGMFAAIANVSQTSFVSQGMSKPGILENLDQVLLVLDEVTDDGVIMETDEEKIQNRVRMVEEESHIQPEALDPNAPLDPNASAQAMFQMATQNAKKRLIDSLLGAR